MITQHKSKKYIFVLAQNSLYDDLLADVSKKCSDEIIVIKGATIAPSNMLLKVIKRVHFSGKVNKIFRAPFKRIWYTLDKIQFDINTQYVIVFWGIGNNPMDTQYLLKMQDRYDIKYGLILFDPLSSRFSSVAREYVNKIKWDFIFTYDDADAYKYHFMHSFVPYTTYPICSYMVKDLADLIFVGINKDRIDEIHTIYKQSQNNGVKSFFRVTEVPKRIQIQNSTILYNERIRYRQCAEEVQCCNCILEILSEGHSGATLRYYEAVCYNKKLLTNNKNVVNLPFYNPDYIHIFEKPEDIDWDWVKERIPVDYHYDGRFSPTHMIDKIIALEEEKEREQDAKKETS